MLSQSLSGSAERQRATGKALQLRPVAYFKEDMAMSWVGSGAGGVPARANPYGSSHWVRYDDISPLLAPLSLFLVSKLAVAGQPD